MDWGLDSLGEDLVLLSISPADGRIATAQKIGCGLMGSELVRLAAAGRITIESNRVVVQGRAPCGDAELDVALDSLADARREVRPKTWVGHPRRGICDAYLTRLTAAGAVRAEQGTRLGIFPVTRWRVADEARVTGARARLDAIALSGETVNSAQAAYAGLAHAVGLGALLYPGWGNRQVRARLERIAKGEWAAAAVTSATAFDAAAATMAATAGATQAAVQAANQAAIQAAVDAATSAAVDAAHHAATAGGAGGTGHH